MATTQPTPRLPLSRERILRAALDRADEGGIESVTMRKLGQALGFEAMSLYNYVANKDDALAGRRLGHGHPEERNLRPRRPPASPLGVHPADVARPRPARTVALHGLAPRPATRRGLLGRDDLPRLPRPRRTHLRLLALADEPLVHPRRGLGHGGDAGAVDQRRRVP